LSKPRALLALAGVATGVAAEHVLLARRRRRDPEAHERFGARRGVRARTIALPDGAHLYVEESGRRRKRGAVFVHGSALRTDVWHYQMTGVGGHRLVFFDLRGHGRSRPRGSAPYSVETLTQDLEAVIEEAGLSEVVIVGHSLGGMVALHLCRSRRADLGSVIKGIVLLNTTHKPPVETIAGGTAVAHFERVMRRPFDTVGAHSHRIDGLRRIVKPSDALFWGVTLSAFGTGASAAQVDFIYDMLADTPSSLIFELFRTYRDFDVADAMADLALPALVLAGSRDRITIPDASRRIAEHMPKAELKVLDGCGHLIMLERHREFNTMLESFLNDTLGRPTR
jgi:pimeloyl-ACP methyl ester carboxylesterase